jgi:hypothetical protein
MANLKYDKRTGTFKKGAARKATRKSGANATYRRIGECTAADLAAAKAIEPTDTSRAIEAAAVREQEALARIDAALGEVRQAITRSDELLPEVTYD